MEINNELLSAIKSTDTQLIVVTKYWNKEETQKLIQFFKTEPLVLGWGENRTLSLIEKQLPKDRTHFIGRLQSRQLPVILEHCSVIHSLAQLKHAQKINTICEQNNYSKVKVFIQINIALDPSKEGIEPSTLAAFLEAISKLKQLEVVGLSSMGWGVFSEKEKLKEFKALIELKNLYVPNGKTSAGTSRDYHLALKAGVDIIRVGKAIYQDAFDE